MMRGARAWARVALARFLARKSKALERLVGPVRAVNAVAKVHPAGQTEPSPSVARVVAFATRTGSAATRPEAAILRRPR